MKKCHQKVPMAGNPFPSSFHKVVAASVSPWLLAGDLTSSPHGLLLNWPGYPHDMVGSLSQSE